MNEFVCKCCGLAPIHMVHFEKGTHSFYCPDCDEMTEEYVTEQAAKQACIDGKRKEWDSL